MLYAGLDLSRQRLDVHVLDEEGRTVEVTAIHPDGDALRSLAAHDRQAWPGREGRHRVDDGAAVRPRPARAVAAGTSPSVTRSRSRGWRRSRPRPTRSTPASSPSSRAANSCPRSGCPPRSVRAERERARFRLHLVRHRTALKNRIHATLMTFGHPVPMADLFGESGRALLDRHRLPSPWDETLATSLAMVDELDERIRACTEELRTLGADHPSIPLLMTVPGVGWVLAYTIASEIGDIQSLRQPQEARRLHRPLPARPPVGRP